MYVVHTIAVSFGIIVNRGVNNYPTVNRQIDANANANRLQFHLAVTLFLKSVMHVMYEMSQLK